MPVTAANFKKVDIENAPEREFLEKGALEARGAWIQSVFATREYRADRAARHNGEFARESTRSVQAIRIDETVRFLSV